MSEVNVSELALNMNKAGIPADYSPQLSRFLIGIWRSIAEGHPVPPAKVYEMANGLGISREEADQFLAKVAERDEHNNLIGALGLTQSDNWMHRFVVNGASLRTWCAWDTLFLPQVLKKKASIESESPVSKRKVRLTIGPQRIENYSPDSAVVSIVSLDPQKHDQSKVEALWSNL
jgi:alkylmercury lyase